MCRVGFSQIQPVTRFPICQILLTSVADLYSIKKPCEHPLRPLHQIMNDSFPLFFFFLASLHFLFLFLSDVPFIFYSSPTSHCPPSLIFSTISFCHYSSSSAFSVPASCFDVIIHHLVSNFSSFVSDFFVLSLSFFFCLSVLFLFHFSPLFVPI